MDVIQSLHIPEQFSEESVDMAFEIGKAFVDCHLVTEAESYLKLLQTVPTYRPAEVFELLYLCAKEKGDTDRCIDYLLKALQALPESSNDKRRQLAVLLTQLYDERGELLRDHKQVSEQIETHRGRSLSLSSRFARSISSKTRSSTAL